VNVPVKRKLLLPVGIGPLNEMGVVTLVIPLNVGVPILRLLPLNEKLPLELNGGTVL